MMSTEIERRRRDLETARGTSARLWKEYSEFAKTLDPAATVATEEQLRRMQEASDWTGRIYAAEQALFKAEHGTPCMVGTNGRYCWLTLLDWDIESFLELCPSVVLGRHIAVTRVDSGPLRLTAADRELGWRTSEHARFFIAAPWLDREDYHDWKIAYSPQINRAGQYRLEGRAHACAGYEEWHLFPGRPPETDVESFVSWPSFRPNAPEWDWCTERLFAQLESIQTESYLADGTVFLFATRDSALFDAVLGALPPAG